MKLSEVARLAKTLDLSPMYVKEMADKSDDLLELVAGIRRTVMKAGVIDIYLNDTFFKRGVHLMARSNFICNDLRVNYSSKGWKKKFYYPLRREDMGLVTAIFADDFSEQYGTTDHFYCQEKYPILIEKDTGIYRIGVKSKDSEMVHAVVSHLVKTR